MRYDRSLVDEHILVSVDPGKRLCGVALWDGVSRQLIRAGAVHGDGTPNDMVRAVLAWVGTWSVPLLYVVETPKRYKHLRSTHDGVASLEAVLSVIETVADVRAHYAPYTWKANVPKAVHHKRLARALHPLELIDADTWDHNVWDGVGIGLYALGRTERGGKVKK